MKTRDRLFSFYEIVIDAAKFHGVAFSLRFLCSVLYVKFFLGKKKRKHKIFGMEFNYLSKESLLNALLELYGKNVYYFSSDFKDPVILDIGANVGDTALYFKWLFPDAWVYAFEPNPGAYNLLVKNVQENNFKNVFFFTMWP